MTKFESVKDEASGAWHMGGALATKKEKKRSIPVLSFFCGAGGMDLGFSDAGFEAVLAIDNFQAAIDTYNLNLAPVARNGNLDTLDAASISKWVEETKLEPPRGIIGGPPCQGFSSGNVRQAAGDKRNILPYRYAHLLGQLAQRFPIEFFVLENVLGLSKPKHARRLARIKGALRRAGFDVHQAIIDAVDFGVPQRRKRLFLVGFRSSNNTPTKFEFPVSTAEPVILRDAIGDLPAPTFCPTPHATIPNHWTMKPKSKRFTTGKFNRYRSFRILDWNKPSPTVAYGNREIHIHPEGNRRLSVHEALTIQGFPSDFELTGTFSAQVTQVSNAVPPPVAFAIASAISRYLKERHEQPHR